MENTKDRLDKLKLLLEQPKEEETIKPKKKRGKNKNPLEELIPSPSTVDTYKPLHFDIELSPKQLEFVELYIPMYYNITAICSQIGVSRQVYYGWCKDTKGFKELINDLEEGMVDKAIEVINRTMDALDPKSAMFVLKTKGKQRGFGETIDITSNGETIQMPTINVVKPKDELED